MLCLNCGKEIPDESKFCPYCGQDIIDSTNTVVDQTIVVQTVDTENNYQTDTNNNTESDSTITQVYKDINQESQNFQTQQNPQYSDSSQNDTNSKNKTYIVAFIVIPIIIIAIYLLFFNKKINKPSNSINNSSTQYGINETTNNSDNDNNANNTNNANNNNNSNSATNNNTITSLDPSTLSTDDLISISSPIVLGSRNYHVNKTTATLNQIYKLTDKNNGSYGLAYDFETPEKEHLIVIMRDLANRSSDNGYDYNYSYYEVGKSFDLSSVLSAYNYVPLGNYELINNKYSIGHNGIVANKGVRVRAGAGINHQHVKINGKDFNYIEGETLKIVDEAIGTDGNIWYQVNFNRNNKSYTYWISGVYLEIVY